MLGLSGLSSTTVRPQLDACGAELRSGFPAVQATIEKASIDEVYIDVTAMVDTELQVLVHPTRGTLLPNSQEVTATGADSHR